MFVLYLLFDIIGCNMINRTAFHLWSLGNLLLIIANLIFIGMVARYVTSDVGKVCSGYYLKDHDPKVAVDFYNVYEAYILVILAGIWAFYFLCVCCVVRFNYKRFEKEELTYSE